MSWAEEQDWFGMEDLVEQLENELNEMLVNDPKSAIKQGYWITANKEPILISDMKNSHLDNCIKMIEDGRLKREWALPYLRIEKLRRIRKIFDKDGSDQ